MKRPVFLNAGFLAAAMGFAAFAGSSSAAARKSKPNFLLIFMDNVGYGDLGCYGNREVLTPHIDQLAKEGVRCTEFYIASPSCMPSRGALLTGRHPVRNGLNEQIWKIDELEQVGLPHSERLLPHYLKSHGYATACFGKWNLGFGPGSRPTERGFDEYLGNISGNCDYYTHVYHTRNDLYRGTKPAHIKGYTTDIYADAACDFMRRNAGGPFFLYLPFNAAHYPNPRNKPEGAPVIWQAPAAVFERYGLSPDEKDETRRYRAVLTAMDDAIGRVLAQLDTLGLRQNTIVVVLSDNGAFMIPRRGLECATNKPLRSGGTKLYEGGIRVPCIVRWPGRIEPGSTCAEPLSSMDFVPMFVKAAGATLPTDRIFDGRDPTPALAGKQPSPHKYLFFHYGTMSAVRCGRDKLVRTAKDRPWELYDLETDLGETKDLARTNPEVVRNLASEFERWFDGCRRSTSASRRQPGGTTP